MKKNSIAGAAQSTDGATASQLIDIRIEEMDDWRGDTLGRARALIQQAVPSVVEELKWKKPSNPAGVPVWSCGGILCTGETYKDKIKLTFPKGAKLADPKGLFNASLDGNARRAIDLRQDDKLDAAAFKALIKAAAAANSGR